MSNHDEIRKLLSAYCGDDLEAAERIRVEEHLAGCAICRDELADLQTALRLIRTTPEAEPPAWLATRVMTRVREQQQEKRSWLQRFFFPLHIKLPIEVAALLMVCVTGYYLARNMESELQQPASQRSTATTPETGKPAVPSKDDVPATVPPPALHPSAKKELRSEERISGQPPPPKAVDQGAPDSVPETPGKSIAEPAFAPAPPAVREERSTPTVERKSGFMSDQSLAPVEHSMPAAAKMKKSGKRTVEQEMATSEAARGASGAPAYVTVPQARLLLHLSDPASAPGAVKEAVYRSGGLVIDDGTTEPNSIRIRIPLPRMDELLERLGRLGKIVEQQQSRDLPGIVEIKIIW